MAFPTGWTGKLEIQSDATKVSGSTNLTDFPALISDGNLSSAVYAGLKSDAGDLRITTDSAGTTEIPFEIVSFNQGAETCEIWAKVPTLSYNSATSLFIWYGNSSALPYDATDTYGSQAVWSDYSGVWHLNETSGNREASDPNNDNLGDGNTVTSATGKIGTSAQFTNANSEYLSTADTAVLSTGNIDFELHQWVYLDNKTTNQKMLSKWTSDPNNEWFTQYNSSDDKFQFGVSNDGTAFGAGVLASTLGSPSISTWYHIICRHYATANKITIQVNGGTEDETAYSSGVYNSNASFEIGRIQQGATDYLDGRVDEARFIKTVHSTDWTTTEYNNQNDPSTFWSAVSGVTFTPKVMFI